MNLNDLLERTNERKGIVSTAASKGNLCTGRKLLTKVAVSSQNQLSENILFAWFTIQLFLNDDKAALLNCAFRF